MIDERLRDDLRDLTDQLRPGPHPFERVQRRYQRDRRRRVVAVTAGCAVVLALVAVAPMIGSTYGERTAGPGTDANLHRWQQRLLAAGPRGALAQDPAFANTLVAATLRSAVGREPAIPPSSVAHLLYADDVGPFRVAAIAYEVTELDAGPSLVLWYVGPRGTGPEDLGTSSGDATAPHSYLLGMSSLDAPFQEMEVNLPDTPPESTVRIGLAPAGCTVATAATPDAATWTNAPTGAYVISAATDPAAQWWRVTCGKKVRHLGAAPSHGNGQPRKVSSTDLARALAHARGPLTAGSSAAAGTALALTGLQAYQIAGTPSVAWAGPVREAGRPDRTAVLIAVPTGNGGWVGDLIDDPYNDGSGTSYGHIPFHTMSDPFDPASVVALPTGGDGSTLVITPAGTTQIVAVGDKGTPTPVAAADYAVGTVVRVPRGTKAVQALDASGRVLATGTILDSELTANGQDAWDQP